MMWPRRILVAVVLGLLLFRLLPEQTRGDEKSQDDLKEPTASVSTEDQYYELMRVIADTFEQVDRNYVKEIDRRKLAEAALRGMMEELDPYSNFIAPDELAKFSSVIDQEFGGIGIQITIDASTRRLTVMTPLPGTPAYKAGLRAGDIITDIDGKSTEGMSIDIAVKMLKGKPGEAVTLGILHVGESKVGQVKLVRAIIHVSSVLGDTYKPDATWDYYIDKTNQIAYIRLTTFGQDSAEELKDALQELKASGLKGLVLDLRFNPGGLLSAATEIADLFLESGKIVSTKGRNTSEKVVYARKEGTFSGFPMTILINHFSASASEIVSAALQDHNRAVIIGDRSWGKGSVQNVIRLENGKSALKLTTASYHRPSGKNIHRFPGVSEKEVWGVSPDEGYSVPLSSAELQKYLEYRRNRDVIGKAVPKSDYKDPQLAKALAYLQEQIKGPATTEKPANGKPAGTPPAAAKPEKITEAPAGKTPEKNPAKPGDKSTSRRDAHRPGVLFTWEHLEPLWRKLFSVPSAAA